MKLDLNSCSHIEQYVMEDTFSFRNVIEIHVVAESIGKTWFSYDPNAIAEWCNSHSPCAIFWKGLHHYFSFGVTKTIEG